MASSSSSGCGRARGEVVRRHADPAPGLPERSVDGRTCEEDSICRNREFCAAGIPGVAPKRCGPSAMWSLTGPDQCLSGRCPVGLCAGTDECARDADCANGEFCGDPIAGAAQLQGSAGARHLLHQGRACATGRCSGARCADADRSARRVRTAATGSIAATRSPASAPARPCWRMALFWQRGGAKRDRALLRAPLPRIPTSAVRVPDCGSGRDRGDPIAGKRTCKTAAGARRFLQPRRRNARPGAAPRPVARIPTVPGEFGLQQRAVLRRPDRRQAHLQDAPVAWRTLHGGATQGCQPSDPASQASSTAAAVLRRSDLEAHANALEGKSPAPRDRGRGLKPYITRIKQVLSPRVEGGFLALMPGVIGEGLGHEAVQHRAGLVWIACAARKEGRGGRPRCPIRCRTAPADDPDGLDGNVFKMSAD